MAQILDGVKVMQYGFDPGFQVRWEDLDGTQWANGGVGDLESLGYILWRDMYGAGLEENMYWFTNTGLWKSDQVVKTDSLKQYFVERQDIDFDDLVNDWTSNSFKHVKQFYFHLQSPTTIGNSANTFDITLGWAKNLMDTPDWLPAGTVNLQTTNNDGRYKWDFRTTGRYLAIRMTFNATNEISMTGGDMDANQSHGR
jgi:hypothetical protein